MKKSWKQTMFAVCFLFAAAVLVAFGIHKSYVTADKRPVTTATYAAVTTQTINEPNIADAQPDDVRQDTDGNWLAYSGNQVRYDFNGLAANQYGTWVIAGGHVNFDYNGNYDYNGITYVIQGGKVAE